jgi:hypothetical protein
VPESAAHRLRASAHRAGLPVDLAAALLVEARLVTEGLEAVDVSVDTSLANDAPVALSASESDYVRALTIGRRRPQRTSDAAHGGPLTVALPVRLLARCSPSLFKRAVADDLERAITLEVNALRAGLGMGESVTRRALRELAQRPVRRSPSVP